MKKKRPPLAIELFFGLTKKKPYKYQIDFVSDAVVKKIVNKSRQVGFSYLVAGEALVRAIRDNKIVLIVSPSERQSRHLMDYVYEFSNELKKHTSLNLIEETRTCLRFAGGGAVYSLPNSPNTIRGFKADLCIFDEFGHFLNGSDLDIYEAVLPSVSRGGEIWLISTPYGERGLFCDIWKNSEKHGFKRFKVNWKECADLNIEEIRKTIDVMTFRQEYDNEFLGDTMSYFSYDLLGSCTVENIIRKEGAEIFIGFDVGRRSDFSAVSVLQKKDNVYSLLHFELLRNVPFSEQKLRLDGLFETFRPHRVMIDEGGIGMQMAEELKQKYGFVKPVTFTNDNKNEMMVELKRVFEAKEIQIIENNQLIGALHMIQRIQSGGNVKYESDNSDEYGHADAAWSLALAVRAGKQKTSMMVLKSKTLF